MKNKSFVSLLSAAIVLSGMLAGCAKEELQPKNEEVKAITSETIPVEKALASLNKLVGELYGETRAAEQNYSVEVFGGVKTRAADIALPDTTLYILNSDNGFAVLSAQSKIKTDVFCVTESGSISSEDILNAILKMQESAATRSSDDEDDDYFEDLGPETVPALIASSVLNQWYYGYEPEYETEETRAEVYTGTPDKSAMLETKWDQHAPFNDFRTDDAPAGCVAVAVAQIIEFNAIKYRYRTFKTDPNKLFDWEKMLTVCNCSRIYDAGFPDARKEVSNFLQYIGLKKNCNISYSTSGSGGNADGAKRALDNIKYKSVKKHLGFEKADKNRAIAQLTNGFPMYMGGQRSGGGHAWVLDGVYVRKAYDDNGKYLRTDNFFHINWGWRGRDDGYFTQGVFDTTKRQAIENGVDLDEYTYNKYNYTWYYRTISYSL